MTTVVEAKSGVGIQVESLPDFRVLSDEELDQVAGGILPVLAVAFTVGMAVGALAAIWQISQH